MGPRSPFANPPADLFRGERAGPGERLIQQGERNGSHPETLGQRRIVLSVRNEAGNRRFQKRQGQRRPGRMGAMGAARRYEYQELGRRRHLADRSGFAYLGQGLKEGRELQPLRRPQVVDIRPDTAVFPEDKIHNLPIASFSQKTDAKGDREV